MIITKLDKTSPMESFLDVARLHISEIHFGLLPLLGEEFLSTLYSKLTQVDNTGLWVAEEDGRILGFLLGTADFKKSYLDVFKKSWAKLIVKGLPSVFKKDVLSKLPTILLYPFKEHDQKSDQPIRNSNAELLSIAVHANAQGKGVGRALIYAFESALSEWHVDGDYFVTTNSADPDSTSFYRKVGFLPCGTQKHNDLTLQVFNKKVIQASKKDSA